MTRRAVGFFRSPGKPIYKMTDEELRAFAEALAAKVTPALRRAAEEGRRQEGGDPVDDRSPG